MKLVVEFLAVLSCVYNCSRPNHVNVCIEMLRYLLMINLKEFTYISYIRSYDVQDKTLMFSCVKEEFYRKIGGFA